MSTEKALRAAAKEMQDVMGLEPAIDVKAKLPLLTEQITEAISQIQKGDEFSASTQAVIDEINTPEEVEDEEEEIAVVPKRKAKPVPVEEEDEEEEEVPAPKKKRVKKLALAEEDEVAKPATKKANPFKGTKETLGTTRMIEVAKAVQSIKGSQSIDAIAAVANKNFVKAGGPDNVKQSKGIIKGFLSAAIEWGIVTQDKKGNFSN